MNFYILYNVDIYLGSCYLVTTIKIKTNQTKQTYTPNKEGCLLIKKTKIKNSKIRHALNA